jgi:hypothetical protein
MSEFNVEVRFPSKVYTKAPFIYSGPDFKALSLGFLSDFLTHEQKEYQRLYPLTVSESLGNSNRDLLFSFLHLYVNNGNEKVANLSHPIEINESERRRALEKLFIEAKNIAEFYGCKVIELETHDWSDSEVFFPSSTSFLHLMKNSPSLIKISKQDLEKMGFQCENTLLSYAYKNAIQGKQADTYNDSQIMKTLNPKRYHEIKKTEKFDFRSYELEKKDELFKSINLPFFENTNHTLNRTVGWITKREKTEGMLRWMPNLFEPCLKKNAPYPLLFIDSLEKYQYKGGKIFEWYFNDDLIVLRRLILTAFKHMNEKGIEKIHFSNVEKENENVKMLLEDLGFEENHQTIIFRKRGSE